MNTSQNLRQTNHTINVAPEPYENAATFAEVIADAERSTEPFIDSETPEGHFGVIVSNHGGIQTYWLKGNLADPEARIVARTQVIRDHSVHYVGGSLFGGTLAPQYLD